MDIKRILSNNVSILVGQTNTGKTMLLADMMVEYTKVYTPRVYCFGIRPEITDKVDVIPFSSVREMEQIKNGIIFVDEVGALFDLDNRKQKRMIEATLRLITHHNNRLVLSGLPTDFRKFISAKATCFMYTSLTISDLINGSLAKITLLDYKERGLGAYVLDTDPGTVLCWDHTDDEHLGFWWDTFKYHEKFDTKRNNLNLFQKKRKSRPKKRAN
jgi:hypothetical protein